MRPWLFAAVLGLLAPVTSEAIEVPPVAQAESEEEDSPSGGMPVPPETERKVRDFLDRFVEVGKTPEELAALFTSRVEYYEHGYVNRDDIVRDVERYVKQWPQRRYEVTSVDIITADPESDRIFVGYTVDFEVAQGGRTERGKASYGAIITGIDSNPQVESIKEKAQARSSGSNE
ncbi:MAG TPA: hypothetical protein VEC35_12085 [Noviherbaspirillum sp.]|nr:hypothetical protein [Noviherbaspirillum sp.]